MKKSYFFIWLLIACTQPIFAQNNLSENAVVKIYKITGTVTNDKGEPIPQVTILVNNAVKTASNADGSFEFELSSYSLSDQFSIAFTQEGYNSGARSFHAQMGSTNYSVVLSKPCICDSTVCFSLPQYEFQGSRILSAEDEDFLAIVKDKLNSHPECKIVFTGSDVSKSGINTMRAALGQIQSYLEKLGISPSRVLIETKNGTPEIKAEVIREE